MFYIHNYFKKKFIYPSIRSIIQLNRWNSTKINPKYKLMTLDKQKDIQTLVEEYTAPSLAAALRDREEMLAFCAKLAFHHNLDTLKEVLEPYYLSYLNEEMSRCPAVPETITRPVLEKIRIKLNRLPRKIPTPSIGRSSVLIPLCNYKGKAAIIYTKRSENLRHFKGDICFPGGKMDLEDETVSIAALRECQEELGCCIDNVKILGVMRLDWADVISITGIPVTPIIGYLGEYDQLEFKPNPDEVSEVFAVPISQLCDSTYWRYQEFTAPTYYDDKHKIWGLTGYLTEYFITNIIKAIDIKPNMDCIIEENSIDLNTRIKGKSDDFEKIKESQLSIWDLKPSDASEKKPIPSIETIASFETNKETRLYERTFRYLYQKEKNVNNSNN